MLSQPISPEPMPPEEKVNILLVDDHPENLLTLEAILGDLDENLVKAHSGAEALRCLLEQDFAVILLDVQMPELDGFETASLIRKRPRSRQTPIIFVTAFSTSDNLVFKGYSLGAVDYLFKPIEPTILKSKVNVFVDLYRKSAALERQTARLEAAQKELRTANQQLNEFNAELEKRVQHRTAQLQATNKSLENEIRDRQQAEAALQESERYLRLATNAARLGMWFWNLPTHQLMWTPECKAIFGLPSDAEISYERFLDCLHPDDRSRTDAAVTHALEAKVDFDIEYRVIWPDRSIHWIAAKGRGFYNGSGEPMQMMGITLDITERKEIEEALRQSEERFRQLAENIQAVFWISNPMTRQLLYVSPAYQDVWGRSCQSLYDDYGEWIAAIHPDDRDRMRTILLEEACDDEFAAEYRVIRPDGSVRWVRDRGFPVRDEAGIVCRVTGIAEDITEQKQAEAEREQLLAREQAARAEAETANQMKDEFLAVLSHELRSPLNPILGWSRMLRSRTFDAETRDRALETIERNARLQTQLIEDLLDVTRILQGKLVLNVGPVNLTTTIEAALETVRLAAEAKSIQIHTQLDSQVGYVSGDANRLQQVVWNLLSNAVKFTPEGGQVEVRLAQAHGQEGLHQGPEAERNVSDYASDCPPPKGQHPVSYAQLQVMDTGRGIDPSFLPHVFDRFRQADGTTTRLFGGLGLGLAIVRHLVELHGGTVWAESAGEHQGSMFTVRLPLMADTKQPNANRAMVEVIPDLQNIQVLVVDDETDTREFLAYTLQQYGAEVLAVSSAQSALDALSQSRPDLLLSDIGMPDMDGYMLIRQVRSRAPEQGSQIPAIALTAYASDTDAQRSLAAGFQQHLAKPIEPLTLVMAVANLVRISS